MFPSYKRKTAHCLHTHTEIVRNVDQLLNEIRNFNLATAETNIPITIFRRYVQTRKYSDRITDGYDLQCLYSEINTIVRIWIRSIMTTLYPRNLDTDNWFKQEKKTCIITKYIHVLILLKLLLPWSIILFLLFLIVLLFHHYSVTINIIDITFLLLLYYYHFITANLIINFNIIIKYF